ncbi:hypothetical protein VKT23_010756 [Stygiomarasmius scandens]|uniref:F-box domain-containing protein n=1 Tax=Marasmiellus scandens TaxID=2682957 RepID=A0ABR1JC09_9AGAR
MSRGRMLKNLGDSHDKFLHGGPPMSLSNSESESIELCTHCHHHLHFEPLPSSHCLQSIEFGFPALQARAELSRYQAELDYVDKECSRVLEVVFALRDRSNALEEFINRNRRLVDDCTRALPQELLAEIFNWVGLDPSSPHLVNKRHPAFILSHVCSRWRRLTLAMPSLWSRIEFCLVEESDLLQRRMESMDYFTQLFIARSGQSPLDIAIEIPSRRYWDLDFEEFSVETMDLVLLGRIIRRFYDEAHRWRTASLAAWRIYFHDGVLPWPRQLPIIESLQLDCIFNGWQDIEVDWLILKQIAAPRLKILTLLGDWGISTEDDSVELLGDKADVLDVSSLEDLVCAYDMPYRLTPLLLASPSISVTLKDFICASDLTVISPCKSFTFEPIFTFESYETLTNMFQRFSLPNVKELHVGRGQCLPSYCYSTEVEEETATLMFPVDAFMTLLRNSSAATVTHLSIRHFTITSKDLLKVLSQLPSLTHLSVDERPGNSGMMTAISFYKYALSAEFFERMAGPIAPGLTHISLAFHLRHPFPGKAILGMVESRWRPLDQSGGGLLQQIRLANAKLEDSDQGWVRRLKDEGLDFVLGV